jgi:hypothetical protein
MTVHQAFAIAFPFFIFIAVAMMAVLIAKPWRYPKKAVQNDQPAHEIKDSIVKAKELISILEKADSRIQREQNSLPLEPQKMH